jgi:hypothetical protein
MVANNLNKKLPFVYLPRRSIEMEALSSHTLSGSKWILEAYHCIILRGDKKVGLCQHTPCIRSHIKHPVAFCPMVQQMDSEVISPSRHRSLNDEYNVTTCR